MLHGDMKKATDEAVLFCLAAATGSEIWKMMRDTDADKENEHSYSSPTLYREGKLEYLVVHGGDYVSGHKLEDGAELWRYCLNPQGARYHPTLRFVASPLAAPGMIIAPSAKGGPVVAIKADAQGDISSNSSAILWRRDKGTPDVPSPLYHDGLVYLYRETGNLVCLDGQTGQPVYDEQRTSGGVHRASPVLADGHIYLASKLGVITVVRAGPKFEIVAQNDMGEFIAASPVIANGRLYIRTYDALYAIGAR
jgi:outer membrane protein assembly factor BamB